MCGRFTIISDPINYQMEFDLDMDKTTREHWQPRYNVAPTQRIPIVTDAEKRQLTLSQWGLVPFWAKDGKAKYNMINVRSETIMEKNYFKKLTQSGQRCFILADGFYEWQKPPGGKGPKTPFYIHRKEKKPFVFAGLWDHTETDDGGTLSSCAIITCAPNDLISPIHNRMPVILEPDAAWQWISPAQDEIPLSLLKPYPAEKMAAYPVSRLVNSPANDTPNCVLPVEN